MWLFHPTKDSLVLLSNVHVNVVLMKWFNSNMLAIIHLSIHNIKGRCIICIIKKKLYWITNIQSLKHVIIDVDVCIFQIVIFFVLMLHVTDLVARHWFFCQIRCIESTHIVLLFLLIIFWASIWSFYGMYYQIQRSIIINFLLCH